MKYPVDPTLSAISFDKSPAIPLFLIPTSLSFSVSPVKIVTTSGRLVFKAVSKTLSSTISCPVLSTVIPMSEKRFTVVPGVLALLSTRLCIDLCMLLKTLSDLIAPPCSALLNKFNFDRTVL